MSEGSAEFTPREKYVNRRKDIEKEYWKQPLDKEVITGEGGARTLVLSKLVQVPEHLKNEPTVPGITRVSIYFPGIWQLENPNTGNTGEINLLGDILTGNTDIVVVAKGEGLNNEAYTSVTPEGQTRGAGQSKVAAAVSESLKHQLSTLVPPTDSGAQPQFVFNLVGYSEGATQAASTALELQKFGKVEDITAIAPAGIIGSDEQDGIKLSDAISHVIGRSRRSVDIPTFPQPNAAGQNAYHEREGDTLYIDSKLLGSSAKISVTQDSGRVKTHKVTQGFEGSLGEKAELKPFDDIGNVVSFFKRMALQEGEDVTNSVPKERVKAAVTKNPDYDKVLKSGTNLTVIAGTKDGIFPFGNMLSAVEDLRTENPDNKVQLVAIVDGVHGTAHFSPNGAAYVSELVKRT